MRKSGNADADAILDALARRLWTRIPLAHVAGGALALASGILTGRVRGQPNFGWSDAVALVLYFSAVLPVGWWLTARLSSRACVWLVEGRAPTYQEQRRTLMLPWYQAIIGMAGWAGAAVLWSFITIVAHPVGYTVRVALSILLGGLATCGLLYLIVEWAIRPVTALALAGNVPQRPIGPGMKLKLLMAWAAGSDVFLAMIGLSYVGRPSSQPPSEAAIWFIIGAGLVAGTAVLFVASRSLVTPLRELRLSVDRVQRGDLDAKVSVDDGGEIGLLQAGFNQMVAGLRERRTLQDLFGRHVGEEVARQAIDQGVGLGGERREVGVVFVDIIGSTALARRESPEVVLDILNDFFSTIVRVVAAEGGWVNKFEGDGALAVFGAPVARDDYALRALRAARTLRKELLVLTATRPALDAAIGVSAGVVVAGNVGAAQRYEYTVIGPAVNEAARLTDEAKQRLGRVLASEEAVARAGPEAQSWLVADELRLRGHSEPTLVYEPSGVGALATRT